MESNQVAPVDTIGQIELLDDQGKCVTFLPDGFGHYSLVVHAEGPWHIQNSDTYVHLDKDCGIGMDTVSVLVGRNWSESREVKLDFCSDSLSFPGSTQHLVVRQASYPDLSVVTHKVNSSMGAGYSYYPADLYTMGTGIQIFNMAQFPALQSEYSVNLMSDDYYPSLKTSVYTSDSLDELKAQLKVSLTADVDLKLFTLTFKGELDQSNVSSCTRTYAAQRLNSTMFSREVLYQNALALVDEHPELRTRVFSAGFMMLHDDLVRDINGTQDIETRQRLCRSFIQCVGSCFVSKSLLGCSMDYWISVDKSKDLDETSIAALLRFKWDSAISINVNSEGGYSETIKTISTQTQANFDIRGGNVQDVSILSTGGTLPYSDLQKWIMNVEPDKAVLIDMRLEPIYLLFSDHITRESLHDYFNSMIK